MTTAATAERFNIQIDPWVQKFASWATGRIGKLIVDNRLRATLHGTKVGPVTVTYRMTLDDLSGRAMDKLLGMGPVIANACNAEAARVSRTRGFIDIELALPGNYAQTPDAKWLASKSEGMNVCVGVDATCLPVHINLADHGAVLWVGPSRSGKTQSLKSVLYSLLKTQDPHRPLSFVVLSQKVIDWQPFEKVHGCLGVISDSDKAMAVAQWAADEVDRRARAGRNVGGEFVIIADDLLNLLSRAPKLGGPLGDIASMGAGLGIRLLIGTQDAGSNRTTGSSVVEANATARVMYRAASSVKAATSSGAAKTGLEDLSGVRGDALVKVDGRMVRAATGYMNDGWLIGLGVGNRMLTGPKPWDAGGERQHRDANGGGARVIALGEYNQHNHHNRLQLVDSYATPQKPVETPNEGWYAEQPVGQPVAQPPVQPPVQPSGAVETAVEPHVVVPSQPPVQLVFPVRPARSLTGAEAAEIRRLRAGGMSINKLRQHAYGYKDGRNLAWIKQALGLDDETGDESGDGQEGVGEENGGAA